MKNIKISPSILSADFSILGEEIKKLGIGQGFDVVGEVSKMTGKSRAEIEKAGEAVAHALYH